FAMSAASSGTWAITGEAPIAKRPFAEKLATTILVILWTNGFFSEILSSNSHTLFLSIFCHHRKKFDRPEKLVSKIIFIYKNRVPKRTRHKKPKAAFSFLLPHAGIIRFRSKGLKNMRFSLSLFRHP